MKAHLSPAAEAPLALAYTPPVVASAPPPGQQGEGRGQEPIQVLLLPLPG